MTKEELIEQLGTIAHSGTKAFLERLESADDEAQKAELIGQFGVGFYSAFLVADRVDVISRGAGADESWMWSSTADDTWTITPLKELTERGTAVVLHLKEGMDSYLNDWTLRHWSRTTRVVPFPIKTRQPPQDEEERRGASTREKICAAATGGRGREYRKFFTHLDPAAVSR